MRRSSAALALALAAALSPAVAAAQTITAPLGRAVRVPLAGAAADVIVGNPKVADVTVISANALFISGRGYGSTNLIVMDRTGRTIFNGHVLVPVPDEGQVTVQRGRNAYAMFCAPNCDRVISGDAGAEDIAAAEALSAAPSSPAPTSTPIAAVLQ